MELTDASPADVVKDVGMTLLGVPAAGNPIKVIVSSGVPTQAGAEPLAQTDEPVMRHTGEPFTKFPLAVLYRAWN
jgi:hypothetical protein